jgi:FHA domain
MVEQALLLARVAFVVLLYLFVWRVFRLSVRDIRAPQESLILSPEAVRAAGLDLAAPPPADAAFVGELVVVSSPVFPAGTRIVLDDDVTFGRGDGCDVVLAADATVSARHARVFARAGARYLEDAGSTNGTFVNGVRLVAERQLREGDGVRIGDTDLEYRRAGG